MTTPSQAAFEKIFKETRPAVGRGWFTKDANGYTNLGIGMSFKQYEATRKQALEEAIAIFSEARNTVFYGATIELKLEELIT
jgi:hypothetical protein